MMFSICFLVLENACVRQVFNLGVALIASCAGRLSWLTAAPGENFRGFLKEIRDGKIGRPRESRSTLGQHKAGGRAGRFRRLARNPPVRPRPSTGRRRDREKGGFLCDSLI
ncbi:hypothetical protein [Burkholderia ubonensis]|uniref:hypothetical protein n=1 Tax=Burkholderia ubonensis TaxID=101571 RepID=UPI0012FC2990|nr:hypothetical protein [Burkholderia ubonensis]